MPKLVRLFDEIMKERKTNTCIVKFKMPHNVSKRSPDANPYVTKVLGWLDQNQVSYELTAPEGHYGGYSGLYAIYFKEMTGDLWDSFLSEFENEDGSSKHPEYYYLLIISYEGWLTRTRQEDSDSEWERY